MDTSIVQQWHSALTPHIQGLSLVEERINQETGRIFPPQEEIFSAFAHCPYEKVQVVILGQDPYHGQGQANGLAFSVAKDKKIPPSLQNIFKELEADCQITPPPHGDLSGWAKQGVFLLNTVLTVAEGQANSHRGIGWEAFTDAVLSLLQEKTEPVVFLLWGASSMKKEPLLTAPQHLILTAPHPSPLSAYRGFLGCGHFSKTNQFLLQQGKTPIQW